MTSNTPINMSALRRGDILFYRTTKAATFSDLNQADFKDFPVLAAYSQGLPYVLNPSGNEWNSDPAFFKPWYHVSVYIGQRRSRGQLAHREVSFQVVQANAAAAPNLDLRPRNVTVPKDQSIVVLRAPDGFREKIAKNAEDQVAAKTIYSLLGLLSFVYATKARVPEVLGTLSTEALDKAFGASIVARDDSATRQQDEETCVTAVAKAVSGALPQKLNFPEPPQPDPNRGMKLHKSIDSPLVAVYKALKGNINPNDLSAVFTAEEVLAISGQGLQLDHLVANGKIGRDDLLQAIIQRNVTQALRSLRDFDPVLTRAPRPRGPIGPGPMGPGPVGPGSDLIVPVDPTPWPDPFFPRPNQRDLDKLDLASHPGVAESADFGARLDAAAVAMGVAAKSKGQSLAHVGSKRTPGDATAEDFVVSPAMLWDELIIEGFTPEGTVFPAKP